MVAGKSKQMKRCAVQVVSRLYRQGNRLWGLVQ